jgi:hypothetical protein
VKLHAVAFVALGALGAGCVTTSGAAAPLVRVEAAKDLDCPDADIVLEEQVGGRYKAIGCGRKAYYKTACQGLQCEVRPEGDPSIPWGDRPDPQDPAARR